MIKGRPAFAINLSSKGIVNPTEIKFSPGGDRFSLVYQQSVDVWTISKAGVEKHITCNSKPTTVQWVTDERLFVGLENGNIISLTVSDNKAVTYQAHKQRVKSLHYENNMLYSAASSGELKVWFVSESKLTEICSNNAGCRITCVALNALSHLIKKEEDSGDEEEDKKQDVDDEVKSDPESDTVEETVSIKELKRKPGAFVRISYDNETDNVKSEDASPPKKKFKKRKRNKKVNKSK